MYKVVFLKNALDDIKNIASYISNKLSNKEAAYNFTEKIIKKADILSDFPYGRPVYMPIRKLEHEYRTIFVNNYIMFYWIEENKKEVVIARVIYSKRNIDETI